MGGKIMNDHWMNTCSPLVAWIFCILCNRTSSSMAAEDFLIDFQVTFNHLFPAEC